MDRRIKINNQLVVLTFKGAIGLYRAGLCPIILFWFCFSLVGLQRQNVILFVVSLLSFIVSILASVFMDKLIYILNLASPYLIVSKHKIIYMSCGEKLVFKPSEINYKYYPAYKRLFLEHSALAIFSENKPHEILITYKQFKLMEQFLNGELD